MDLLLDIRRGLILVEPYGNHIKKHKKNIIIKSKIVKTIVNVNLLLIENKLGLGVIRLGEPDKINLKKFSTLRSKHLISETDRKKWWNKYKMLYMYPITKSKFFKIPILLDYPTGPQITVLPNNINFKKVFIGTAGYYYKWMYPKSVKNMLEYYSQNLNSVEINSTFYRFPTNSTIVNLQKYDLTYSIKVNQKITHHKKLANVKKLWNQFYYSLEPVHNKIKCFLFQFSAKFYFTPETYILMKKLSTILNKAHRYAFEFRNLSWYDNDKLNKLFKKNNWMITIVNVKNINNWAGNLNDGFNLPLSAYISTSDSIYIRLHGTIDQYMGSYDDYDYKNIFNFIKEKKNIINAFVYFNNTDLGSFAFDNAIDLSNKFNLVNLRPEAD